MVSRKNLQGYKSLSSTCQKNNDKNKGHGTGKKSIWELWFAQHMGLELG